MISPTLLFFNFFENISEDNLFLIYPSYLTTLSSKNGFIYDGEANNELMMPTVGLRLKP